MKIPYCCAQSSLSDRGLSKWPDKRILSLDRGLLSLDARTEVLCMAKQNVLPSWLQRMLLLVTPSYSLWPCRKATFSCEELFVTECFHDGDCLCAQTDSPYVDVHWIPFEGGQHETCRPQVSIVICFGNPNLKSITILKYEPGCPGDVTDCRPTKLVWNLLKCLGKCVLNLIAAGSAICQNLIQDYQIWTKYDNLYAAIDLSRICLVHSWPSPPFFLLPSHPSL